MAGNRERLEILLGARADGTLDRTLSGVTRRFRGLGLSLAGIGLGASLNAGINATITRLRMVSDEVRRFESEMTGLVAVEDNVNRIARLKDEVLSLSNAWGVASGVVSQALYSIQSSASNLPEKEQRDLLDSAIELSKFYGSDMANVTMGLTKTFQIYREELRSVREAQQKLALLADEGVVEFEEIARLFPDVASAAEAMGVSFDTVVAALIPATQRGGRTEVTFTGLRNVILRMNNAQKEGILLTGSFTDKLRQLGEVADPQMLERIFGAQALAAANNLIKSVDQIDEALDRMSQKLPDVGDKIQKRLEDTSAMFAEIANVLDQLEKNSLIGVSLDANRVIQGHRAAEIGAARRTAEAPLRSFLLDILTLGNTERALAVADPLLGSNVRGEVLQQAVQDAIAQGNLTIAGELINQIGRGAFASPQMREIAQTLRQSLRIAERAEREDRQRAAREEREERERPFRESPEFAEFLRSITTVPGTREGLDALNQQREAAFEAFQERTRREQAEQASREQQGAALGQAIFEGLKRFGTLTDKAFGEGEETIMDRLLGRTRRQGTLAGFRPVDSLGRMLTDLISGGTPGSPSGGDDMFGFLRGPTAAFESRFMSRAPGQGVDPAERIAQKAEAQLREAKEAKRQRDEMVSLLRQLTQRQRVELLAGALN